MRSVLYSLQPQLHFGPTGSGLIINAVPFHAFAAIEDGLTGFQFGQRRRVAAAKRGFQRRIRHFAFLRAVVKV